MWLFGELAGRTELSGRTEKVYLHTTDGLRSGTGLMGMRGEGLEGFSVLFSGQHGRQLWVKAGRLRETESLEFGTTESNQTWGPTLELLHVPP